MCALTFCLPSRPFMKSDRVYLEQMLESVGKIRDFVRGMDYDAFLKDQKTQSAVIMQLALIGELAKRVSGATRSDIDVPWKEITGFRDRAIHDYYQMICALRGIRLRSTLSRFRKRCGGILSA